MDGLKRRLNESVQLKLSFTLSLAILVVAIVAFGGATIWWLRGASAPEAEWQAALIPFERRAS